MTTSSSPLEFPITVLDNLHLMTLPSRLSVTEAVAFREAFKALVQSHPSPTQIALDLSQTRFLDSSGLGALVMSQKLADSSHINLALWSVQDEVRLVLSMTGMESTFTIQHHTDQSDAETAQAQKKRPPSTHPSIQCRTKRVVDVVGSIIGLGVTGVLLIPIALCIYIDSPGPIFFGQIRCGWMGKRFRIWKFRSMVTDAELLKHKIKNQMDGPIFKNDNDPRITRVGRFLRKTSLDELPQFWNVLKGDMSLIGTRPPTPDELERYEVPSWQRLDVKPGMSGEWQVNGRSQVRSFADIIRMDLTYQENWSLMYDFKLILKTILVIFRRRSGAA